ncbi:MAG: electron transfer flavoprotein subunit beta/FixA family protein [Acidimicrobiia bacterium]|nr:electron transfer flavoprotein subunit beta/FixA family protein [Acidimicrobiia bacterium]
MKVAVCVKQIPDPATPYTLQEGTNWLVRPDDQVMDDTDRYGVEMGLQLADSGAGAVTLFSMGPTGNAQAIRQALAMGADKAVLIDDAALGGSDALTTARVLAAAIEKEGYDLIIAGTESTDGYTGVVPQMLAEILGIPSLTYATHVEAANGEVMIHRQTSAGYDVVKAQMPAVVAVTAGVVEPRYPTFKGIMDAKKKPVETLTVGDLSMGPKTDQEVKEVTDAPERSAGRIVEDDGSAHLEIVALLEERKVI